MNSKSGGWKTDDGRPLVLRSPGETGRTTFRQNPHENRRGMTLVEVLLAAAILGIMAVVIINALFYPRFLAASSTLKQMAVQAGTGEIERLRSDYTYATMPPSFTTNLTSRFNLNGRFISATDTVTEFSSVNAPGYTRPYKYKRITVTVSYGTTNLVLTSYRSTVNGISL